MTFLYLLLVKFQWFYASLFLQDADESSPLPTSSDIVKVPDPQMCMVSGTQKKKKSLLSWVYGFENLCWHLIRWRIISFKMIKLVSDGVGILLQENLVESKHHKLARSLRSGPSDHDLKPNAATRDQLNVSDKEKKKYSRNLLRCLYNTVFLL